jgi:hypothetical protein
MTLTFFLGVVVITIIDQTARRDGSAILADWGPSAKTEEITAD